MWDNLNKEGQRRTEAEFQARRLKKKVEELQFLLDELKEDSSDDSDGEEEKEKGAENTNFGEKIDQNSTENSENLANNNIEENASSSDEPKMESLTPILPIEVQNAGV